MSAFVAIFFYDSALGGSEPSATDSSLINFLEY